MNQFHPFFIQQLGGISVLENEFNRSILILHLNSTVLIQVHEIGNFVYFRYFSIERALLLKSQIIHPYVYHYRAQAAICSVKS